MMNKFDEIFSVLKSIKDERFPHIEDELLLQILEIEFKNVEDPTLAIKELENFIDNLSFDEEGE